MCPDFSVKFAADSEASEATFHLQSRPLLVSETGYEVTRVLACSTKREPARGEKVQAASIAGAQVAFESYLIPCRMIRERKTNRAYASGRRVCRLYRSSSQIQSILADILLMIARRWAVRFAYGPAEHRPTLRNV